MHALIFRANPNYRRHYNRVLHNYRKLQYGSQFTQNTHMSTSRVHQDRFPTINYDLHVYKFETRFASRVTCLAAVVERDNSPRKIS